MADEYQYVKLPDGSYGKFRADASDDVIRSVILKDFPNAFGEPQTKWAGLENAKPRGLSNPRFGQPMAEFQPAADAARQAEEEHQRNLTSIAKTGAEIPGSAAKSSLLRNISGISGAAESAFSPQGAAIAAAQTNPFTAVPVDVGLIGHGLYRFGSNVVDAFRGNPNAAEASLGGLGEAAGGAAGLRAFKPRFNVARSALAQKAVEPLVYENLGETGADVRMGINPERGIVREGLTGTKTGLLEKANTRVGELKQAANDILKNHPNSIKQIDAEPIIDEAIDRAVVNQRKVAGDTARLENLRTALKEEYGATKGTPFEINNLKTSIQEAANNVGAYKNTQPIEGSLADAMREVANGIRNKVNEAIPEAALLNERMSDLIDAQGGLRKNINASKGRSIFGGFHEGMSTTLANRTLGSAPVRSGLARVLSLGQAEAVPRPSPFSPQPAAGLLTEGATQLPYEWQDTSGPSGTGIPERTVQRGASGRMQRVYMGTSQPAPIGSTPKGPIYAPRAPIEMSQKAAGVYAPSTPSAETLQENPFSPPRTYAGPERRTLERGVTTSYDLPTEGEVLGEQIRQSRGSILNRPKLTEGEALQQIMRDPDAYAKYRAADKKTRDAMLVRVARSKQ